MDRWIAELMQALGYAGIGLLMFLENVVPPIPSELIMPLAGFSAASGELSLFGVIAAGSAGALLGQLPLYYLGRAVGAARLRAWAERYGRWLLVSGEDIDRATGWFERRGRVAVLLCRLVPGLRSLISLPAGVAHMPLGAFMGYSALGIALWSTALAVAGYSLGTHYEAVERYIGPLSRVALGGLALGVAGLLALRLWQRLAQRSKRQGPSANR